jgi:hypothetical protein
LPDCRKASGIFFAWWRGVGVAGEQKSSINRHLSRAEAIAVRRFVDVDAAHIYKTALGDNLHAVEQVLGNRIGEQKSRHFAGFRFCSPSVPQSIVLG